MRTDSSVGKKENNTTRMLLQVRSHPHLTKMLDNHIFELGLDHLQQLQTHDETSMGLCMLGLNNCRIFFCTSRCQLIFSKEGWVVLDLIHTVHAQVLHVVAHQQAGQGRARWAAPRVVLRHVLDTYTWTVEVHQSSDR